MLKHAQPPIDQAWILICEKCGKKLTPDNPEGNPSRALQQTLKEKIFTRFGKGKVRALVTTCMDICPSGEVAVGILRAQGKDEYLTIPGEHAAGAADEVLERALVTSPGN